MLLLQGFACKEWVPGEWHVVQGFVVVGDMTCALRVIDAGCNEVGRSLKKGAVG